MSGNLDPNNSPRIASGTPLSAKSGVRRLNNVPLIAIFGIALIVGGTIIYTFHERMVDQERKAQEASGATPQAGSANDVLSDAPAGGLIVARQSSLPPTALTSPADGQTQQGRQLNPIEQARVQAWQDYEQHRQLLEQAKFQAEISAIGTSQDVRASGSSGYAQLAQAENTVSGVTGTANQGIGSAAAPSLDTMQSGSSSPSPATAIVSGLGNLGAGLIASGSGIPSANPNANDQTGKRNFLAQPGSSAGDDYLQARITTPVSPYEVKAGSVIPATMIGGINSDLPGEVIAQVRENVYDTATGQYLLIPQGSRLVGVYHSGISYGQTRVLVAWNRVIFPNGNSFDLGQMPGTDEGGYAGFNDEVNNHYLRVFGSALLASVFSAGAQLSQPQNSNGSVTSSQVLAASVGQEADNVGSMLIARGLDIQPTLEIRNGYLFNIMVTKDLALRPWDGMQPITYGALGR